MTDDFMAPTPANLRALRDRNARLSDRIDELEETVRQLKAHRKTEGVLLFRELTKIEADLLEALLEREYATNDHLVEILRFHSLLEGGPKPKGLAVYIHKLRRKLRPLDAAITSRFGRGYSISGAHKAIIKAYNKEGNSHAGQPTAPEDHAQ